MLKGSGGRTVPPAPRAPLGLTLIPAAQPLPGSILEGARGLLLLSPVSAG